MSQENNTFTESLHKAFASQTFNQDYLNGFRVSAFEKMSGLALPTTRNEEWKFINLKEVYRSAFAPVQKSKTVDISSYLLPEAAETTLVFINGEFRADQSKIGKLPLGAMISTFAEAGEKQIHELETHLGTLHHSNEDVFTLINTAFTDNGVFVYIPKETKLESPIHILNIVTEEAQNGLITPRCLVCADKFSKATLIFN
jgi:Fe-S cluster assembly protein SufD